MYIYIYTYIHKKVFLWAPFCAQPPTAERCLDRLEAALRAAPEEERRWHVAVYVKLGDPFKGEHGDFLGNA